MRWGFGARGNGFALIVPSPGRYAATLSPKGRGETVYYLYVEAPLPSPLEGEGGEAEGRDG